LRDTTDLAEIEVVRRDGETPEVEEQYRCTSAGIFEVTLSVLEDNGYSRTFRMAKGQRAAPAHPAAGRAGGAPDGARPRPVLSLGGPGLPLPR
jgi:hypothetical protein